MAKSKSKQKRGGFSTPPLDPRARGQQAFNNGRFHEAIAQWTPLAQEERIRLALAEAYFRRALVSPVEAMVSDLQQAITLAPQELRYLFHLGRIQHLQGDLAGAEQQYRAVLAQDASWEAATRLLILLTLTQKPQADLSRLPGMNAQLEQWAAPFQALLRGSLPPQGSTVVERFWQGLGLVAKADPAAIEPLSDEATLSSATLNMLRRYYFGVALGLNTRWDEAVALWQRDATPQTANPPVMLHQNLAALLYKQIQDSLQQGAVIAAATLAYQWRHITGSAAFDELCVQALDQGAQHEASANKWTQAIHYWEAARDIVSRSKGLGSPRTLLHNLALAYEQVEGWLQAAEAWRGLLRTRSRQRGADDSEAARWSWVRTRIIECYKRANRPDEAVTVFRQAIKADPDDLDLRLQLSDALMANQQERSSNNEIERILKIDPNHPDALVRKAMTLLPTWQYEQVMTILRDVIKRHPQRSDLARSAGAIYMTMGRESAQYSRYQQAYDIFVEGESFDPQNFLFPLNQARMLQALPNKEKHDQLVERATELVGNNPEGWALILETWALAKNLPQAQAMLERFEREQHPAAEAYMILGMVLFQRVVPPPPASPFDFLSILGGPFGTPQLPEPAPPPPETPWTRMAIDLFDKAVTLKPGETTLLHGIATLLMLPFSSEALRFAELAVQAQPDNAEMLIMLGIAQGLSEHVPEAKDTLLKASQLAKRQKNRELQDEANNMRKLVGTPALRANIQAQMQTANMLDQFDEDFDLDDLDDFDLDLGGLDFDFEDLKGFM